jgi:beta-galactosidase
MDTFRKFLVLVTAAAALLLLLYSAQAQEKTFDLSGRWAFALDAADQGVSQNWYNQQLPSGSGVSIKLPGILQSQNYGDEIGTRTPSVLSLYDHFWYLKRINE